MFSKTSLLSGCLLLLFHIVGCSLYDPTSGRQLERHRAKNRILHDTLISENCTDPAGDVTRRELPKTSRDGILYELEEKFQEELIQMLIKCRKEKLSTSTTPTTTSTTARTGRLNPQECHRAVALTDSWRRDINGSGLNAGKYNCDTRWMIESGRPWFRFSGEAGNHLLNSCPPQFSCGTNVGLWSDEPMPGNIGIVTAITAYGSFYKNCKQFNKSVSVIRCSYALGDFVYRYDGDEHCDFGFCGMN